MSVAVLPRKEVIRRLRDRNEPVILFGESDIEAFRRSVKINFYVFRFFKVILLICSCLFLLIRLRKLEISEPEINRGLRNDFQEALERVDEAYLNEILSTQKDEGEHSDDGTKPKAGDVKVITDAMSYEEIIELVFLFITLPVQHFYLQNVKCV